MPAAADPDLALRLAKTTADIYGQAVDDLLAIVARRLARGIDKPGWAENKLLEQVRLRNEARAVVERLERDGPPVIEEAVRSGWAHGARQGDIELGQAFGRTNTRAVDALVRETISNVEVTQRQILRTVDDAYRRVISEVTATTTTGTLTRAQATQRALDRFADQGIGSFTDRAGRTWSIDTYAEMATRTATGRAQVEGTLQRYVDGGRDLVIISDAPQECSVCRPYEGRVFSISGNHPDYPPLSGALGLFHANCRHSAGGFVPGLTKPMRHTADPKGDADRQEQRRLERAVRQWKRRELVALDEPTKRAATARRRAWQSRLEQHVDANGLKRLRNREVPRGPLPSSGLPPARQRVPLPAPPGPTRTSARELLSALPGERSKVGQEVRKGLAAIDRVHQVPAGTLKVPVLRPTSMRPGLRGEYGWDTSNRPVHIRLNHEGTGQSGTFAHEYGHYLDHQVLGDPGTFLTLHPDRHMRRFFAAVDASPTGAALKAAPNNARMHYLRMPQEIFARAYAQWIAKRGADPEMASLLQARRAIPGSELSQWSDAEFEDIAAALDALFEAKGLLA